MSTIKSSKRAAGPFMAAFLVHQFVRENSLVNRPLFKGCGVAIHLCKQCDRVLALLFKSSLMISGADCGHCGETLRDEPTGHKQQVCI